MTATPDDLRYFDLIRHGLTSLYEKDYHAGVEDAEQAFLIKPDGPEALFLLGMAAFFLDDIGRAIELMEKAHHRDPDCREYSDVIAVVLTRVGRLNDSLYYAKLATAQRPHPWLGALLPEGYDNYLKGLQEIAVSSYYIAAMRAYGVGEWPKAIAECEKQLRVHPRDAQAYWLMGRALLASGEFGRAIAALHAALHIEAPKDDEMLVLADALAGLGRLDEARAARSRYLATRDGEAAAHSRALRRLAIEPDEIFAGYAAADARWRGRFAATCDRQAYDAKRFAKTQGLRIGYLIDAAERNPDIAFIEPMITRFNTRRFEVYCYQQCPFEDVVAVGLRSKADDWREIGDIDDETVAAIINGDDVDILVDTIGHGENNRQLVLARRAAPLQISWLALPEAGGPEVDWIVDATAGDGVGHGLPAQGAVPFAARQIMPESAEVSSSPAVRGGGVMFGGTCDLVLLNPAVASLWSEVLRAVPGSRLLLGRRARAIPDVRDRAIELFAHFGCADRISFQETAPAVDAEIHFLAQVDIVLDTFPVAGRIETCKALWMGVPTVTLTGSRHTAGFGAGLLRAAGKPQWVAATAEDFVRIAAGLAADPRALEAIRERLRKETEASPLCDVEGFIGGLEAIYERAWKERGARA